jgi:tetratricopeptide (TPR) repeat protein/tRNA A-37 threonylcarbamoyl transferase component Bud32
MRVCPQDGSVLTTPDPLIGTVLADRYKVLSVLGRGGMSIVYKARHQLMDRVVAIKMLHAQLVSDPQSLNRFQLEAKAVSALNHPNIIMVYDFGITEKGLPYLVMDYLEGMSIADIIQEEGQLEVARGVNIFMQACDALAHAHFKNVIHRDLKPSNIMLITGEDGEGVVKIVDFGIAKLLSPDGQSMQRLTQTGEVVGSPLYMSPEQLMGHKLDARSDIYSMGCVIYESLTGKPPFLGDNVIDTMRKHLDEAPTPLKTARADLAIPEHLEHVVLKALAKEPIDRYQTMRELRDDLSSDLPVDLRPGEKKPQPPRPVSLQKTLHLPPSTEMTLAGSPKLVTGIIAGIVVVGAITLWAVFWPSGPMQHYLATTKWEELNQQIDALVPQNRYDDAVKLARQELKIAEGFGEGDQRFLRSLRNLGSLYQIVQDYPNAADMFKRLLAIDTKLFGPEDPRVADCLDNLASVYNHQGKYEEAEKLWLKALAIKKKALGPNDLQTSYTLNLLGKFYDSRERYAEAEPLLKQALGIRSKLLKEVDPERTLVLHNLALLYDHQNRDAEAEKLYQQVLKIYRRTLPPDDPYLIGAQEDYAEFLRKTDRAEQGDAIEARVRQILHK